MNFKINNIIKILITLLFLIIFSFNANSQKLATIYGKVVDKETGEILRGASVQLVGKLMGAYTDIRGEFKIKNVPPGTYSLKVSYIGFNTKEVPTFTINENQTYDVGTIVLENEIRKTDEITVEAYRSNDNETALLLAKKNSLQLSDGISREEIKRLPDADAGQALRRVSGVTLVNDKFIYVRGVSERYSNTTLNGASLATTEPDKKAFAFDIFPSEFLENANIAKSFTPDLPGNFAGGLVQLNTVDFPSGLSVKFTASSALSDNITFKDRSFIRYHGGKTDWLGFDDGSRAIPSIIPTTPADMRKLTADLKSENEVLLMNSSTKWVQAGRKFNDNVWRRDTISAPPNAKFSLSYSDIYNLFDNDFGIIASVLYGNSFSYTGIARGQLQASGAEYNYFGGGGISSFSTNIGAILNLAYKIGSHSSISFKNTYNNTSDDETTIIEGFKEQNMIRQMGFQFVQKSLLASQLTGEHKLPILNSIFDWKIGYSRSVRDEPDFRRVRYSRNDSTQPYRVDIYNLEGNGYQAGRFFSYLKEDAWSGNFNFTLPIDNTKIKLGALYETKTRNFLVRSFTIVKSTYMLKNYYDEDFGYVVPNYGDEDFYNNGFLTDPENLFKEENFSFTRLGISEETKPTDSYSALDNLAAAYLMAEIPFYLGNHKIRFIGGARFEASFQKLQSFYPITTSNSDSTFVDKTYLDLLPSINLIYEIQNDMNLRLSVSRTLTRPSLREYAPFTFYDFQFQGDVTGNVNLVRSLIWNYDARWEWFTNPGELLSVSIFYKQFENAIEETIIPTSSNFKRTYVNAQGNAYNYGVEFELRKNLGFISSALNYFSIAGNLAIINSQITVQQVDETDTRSMWGQSPYSINLALVFNQPEWGTTANISYNVFGRRIIQVADIGRYDFKEPHVYELPRNVIDFSINQSISNNIEIKFIAKDLLNEDLIWKQANKIVLSNVRGRTFSLSFGYKF